MGGHHHFHSYAIQTLAFFIALVPGVGVFALLAGATMETRRRSSGRRATQAIAAWRSDVSVRALAFRK